ncbi:GNAT family N-acetyltransferase [Clostridium estertheticum]|uniref:GNAT family N-acetyltransferase n=1 Tax=Clostridium estertheticum TaxID=238834 RepID=UPI0013E97BF9|nr:GNAT family N-acetyltransferase [Clostridium estertheticum]MBZ9688783.1 GNAT family N-acetyltransferase [Clostridium estertheticum]
MYENVKIETEHLVIRNFTKNDLSQLYRIVNNEEIMRYVPFAKERTLTECEELMKRILNRYKESTAFDFKGFLLLVISKDNNECVGFVGLFPLSYNTTENEIFYGLFEECYRKGYATEIGKSIIEYSFRNMNIDKIVATVNRDNEVSKRVLGKMGMIFEYVIEDEEAKDSSYDGELMYSIEKSKS